MSFGSWFKKAVKSAGRGISGAAKGIGKGVSGAAKGIAKGAKAITKVPVLGDLVNIAATGVSSPFRVAADIATGKRIDRAVMGHFERELANAKTAAPYAQMVVSFVPGIGTVASGAIGAGIALANGQRIDKALLEGVKGALPGGPIAKAAFDVGQGILAGKPIEQIGIAALPIPQKAKELIESAARVTRALASGKRVDQTLLNEAVKQLSNNSGTLKDKLLKMGPQAIADQLLTNANKLVPPALQKDLGKALQIGMAIGQGQSLQALAYKNLTSSAGMKMLIDGGVQKAKLDAVYGAAMKLVPKAGVRGFQIGAGLMQHRIGQNDMTIVRGTLKGEELKAFDIAVSLQIGKVSTKPPPKALYKPAAAAGYAISRGMVGTNPKFKMAMMKTVAADPGARVGAVTAIKEIAVERQTLWAKIKEFFGFSPKAQSATPQGLVLGTKPALPALPPIHASQPRGVVKFKLPGKAKAA